MPTPTPPVTKGQTIYYLGHDANGRPAIKTTTIHQTYTWATDPNIAPDYWYATLLATGHDAKPTIEPPPLNDQLWLNRYFPTPAEALRHEIQQQQIKIYHTENRLTNLRKDLHFLHGLLTSYQEEQNNE